MGFVDFENDDQCQQALAMDGTELEGNNLSVQLASGGMWTSLKKRDVLL